MIVMRRVLKRLLIGAAAVVVVGFGLIQLIPYGRTHTNPPVLGEPAWSSPETRALFMRACGDCHSNETVWPWYSNVAPISWLIQRDVEEGRRAFTVSEWPSRTGEAQEAAETVREGEMPPALYLVLHPEARLAADERAALIAGLAATFGDRRERDRERTRERRR